MTSTFLQRLRDFAAGFDRQFGDYLQPAGNVPPELIEAIRYSVLAPGKRIRPYLATRCCELVGGTAADALPVAAALECVHAFSLIHDDLPAMDDDDLRRGQPTCHKKFGEATAILAGDALIVLAFELLASRVEDQALAAGMVLKLARGAGWAGMIGGQTADVLGESRPPTPELVEYIDEHKTASIFQIACELGAMAGHGGEADVSSLGQFGRQVGRAFQIADDLLDLSATTDLMGKKVGKDAAANKQTLPQCLGIEQSRLAAKEAVEAAITALEGFGTEAEELRALARYVVDRNY